MNPRHSNRSRRDSRSRFLLSAFTSHNSHIRVNYKHGVCLHHWSLRPGGECGLTSIVMLCVYCHSSHKHRALNQNLGSANRYNEAYLYIMMLLCTASNAAGQTRSLISNLCYYQAQPHPLHGNSFDINICFPRPPPCHLDLQLAEM